MQMFGVSEGRERKKKTHTHEKDQNTFIWYKTMFKSDSAKMPSQLSAFSTEI